FPKPRASWVFWCFSLCCLYTCHLITTHQVSALLSQLLSVMVQVTHFLHFSIEHLLFFRVEPIPTWVRFQIELLLKNAPHVGAKST
ncbi:MAG: hypothetical protein OXT74_00230, partial [Candidatus Poribacteria bacterium]|nr:hypothetical protein [Candidatus Poribacteria bacterium]